MLKMEFKLELLRSGIGGGGNSPGGFGKNLKLGGRNKRGGLEKCPRNTAPYILSDMVKLLPSPSFNTTIICTTFSYVVSVYLTAISLFYALI